MALRVEAVADLAAVWTEVEPLAKGIIDYHETFRHQPLRDDWSIRLLEYMSRSNDEALTLLARDDSGASVGFLSGSVRDGGIFQGKTSFVDNAFVAEGARSQGFGSEMLKQFEQWARLRGASEVKLDVVAANLLGLDFWTSRGFMVEMHIMRKELSSS